MKNLQLIVLTFLTFLNVAYAQRPALKVGNNPATINNSAALEIESTTKGFLPPRMTSAQMLAIPSPAQGLMVFCTDCDPVGLRINNGTFSNPVFQYFGVNISPAWTNNTATGISSTGVSTIIDANTIKTVLSYTGSDQYLIPPPGCTSATFVLWGSGGLGGMGSGGGSGGFATGTTTNISSSYTAVVGYYTYGGGGGSGGVQFCDDCAGVGGGRAAISAAGIDVIVAGGGGGGSIGGVGGGGGGATGTNGSGNSRGNGGTQTAGGAATSSGSAGTKNQGGSAIGRANQGGGGGGYYGGSAGGQDSGGGGGSGYIAPYLTNASLLQGSAGGGAGGSLPPQTNHPDYVSGIGRGAESNYVAPGQARIVIYWRK